MKSKHTLFEFVDSVPWENIKERMNREEYKKFVKFMEGQTCPLIDGEPWVYVGDLTKFLANIDDNTLYD